MTFYDIIALIVNVAATIMINVTANQISKWLDGKE